MLVGDASGSVVSEVAEGGVNRIFYTAYGHRGAEQAVSTHLGYNGEVKERQTGCYLLGNGYRAYNPVLMKFHSPDSLSPFGKGGVNPYAYCEGDSINNVDPTGHWKLFGWFRSGSNKKINNLGVKPEKKVTVKSQHLEAVVTLKKSAITDRNVNRMKGYDESSKNGNDTTGQAENYLKTAETSIAKAYRESEEAVRSLNDEQSFLSKNIGKKAISKSRAQELRQVFEDGARSNKKTYVLWREQQFVRSTTATGRGVTKNRSGYNPDDGE